MHSDSIFHAINRVAAEPHESQSLKYYLPLYRKSLLISGLSPLVYENGPFSYVFPSSIISWTVSVKRKFVLIDYFGTLNYKLHKRSRIRITGKSANFKNKLVSWHLPEASDELWGFFLVINISIVSLI